MWRFVLPNDCVVNQEQIEARGAPKADLLRVGLSMSSKVGKKASVIGD